MHSQSNQLFKGLILAFFVTQAPMALAKDTLVLEGVSIIGQFKTAFLSINGTKVSLNKGDYAGSWRIEEVEPRLLKLRSDKGESRELALHSRLSEVPATVITPPKAKSKASDKKDNKNTPQPFKPRQIDDKDIPAGHHKVRTPFGDVIVKDNK